MSKLLKNLKSIFVVEESAKGAKKPAKEKKRSEEKVAPKSEPVISQPALQVSVEEGRVSQKFTDILLKSIEANNQDGFDYIEFKKAVQNLQKMNMAEDTTYKSAFATAQTMGATPDGLISSAEQYLEVLSKEEGKFQNALTNQRTKQVDGKKKKIEELKAKIQRTHAKIEELQSSIGATQEELGQVEASVQGAAAKIEQTSRDFEASFGNLVTQIKTDINNIKKHLA